MRKVDEKPGRLKRSLPEADIPPELQAEYPLLRGAILYCVQCGCNGPPISSCGWRAARGGGRQRAGGQRTCGSKPGKPGGGVGYVPQVCALDERWAQTCP